MGPTLGLIINISSSFGGDSTGNTLEILDLFYSWCPQIGKIQEHESLMQWLFYFLIKFCFDKATYFGRLQICLIYFRRLHYFLHTPYMEWAHFLTLYLAHQLNQVSAEQGSAVMFDTPSEALPLSPCHAVNIQRLLIRVWLRLKLWWNPCFVVEKSHEILWRRSWIQKVNIKALGFCFELFEQSCFQMCLYRLLVFLIAIQYKELELWSWTLELTWKNSVIIISSNRRDGYNLVLEAHNQWSFPYAQHPGVWKLALAKIYDTH